MPDAKLVETTTVDYSRYFGVAWRVRDDSSAERQARAEAKRERRQRRNQRPPRTKAS